MEDYREIGPPGNGKTRKTGASNLAAVRETTRHVRIHASRVIFRGAPSLNAHQYEMGWAGYAGAAPDLPTEIARDLKPRLDPEDTVSDISQLTFKSMAIVSTLHRHGNSIPFAALR